MDETRKLVVSIVVVLLLVAGLTVLIYFGVKTQNQLKGDITDKEQLVVGLEAKIAQIPDLRKHKEMLAESQEIAERVLPDVKELEALDEVLTSFERQSGFELLERNPRLTRAPISPQAPQEPYEKYTYTLKGRGDFFAFVKLLSLLERHERFIRVDSFDIKVKPEESEEFPLCDVSLEISTFSYAAPTPAPAAAPQTGATTP